MGRLTLAGIGKDYAGVEVSRDIDLTIEDGEFVVFVGPPAAASPPCCA